MLVVTQFGSHETTSVLCNWLVTFQSSLSLDRCYVNICSPIKICSHCVRPPQLGLRLDYGLGGDYGYC